MRALLNTVRWVIAIVLSLLLTLIITVTPYFLSLSTFVTNRQNIFELINATGIYNNLEDVIIETMESDVQSKADSKNPNDMYSLELSKNEIHNFFTSILTPKFIKNTVEQTINGIYDYLEHKTNKPVIKLDKKPVKDAYFKVLTQAARRTMPELPKNLDLTKLPECKSNTKVIDTVALCLPKDLDLNAKFDELTERSNLNTDKGSIYFDLSQSTDFNFYYIQTIYTIAKYLPLIILGALIIITSLIIFLIPNKLVRIIFAAVIGIIPALVNTLLFAAPKIFHTNPIFKIETYLKLKDLNNSEIIIKSTNWLIAKLETQGLLISLTILILYILLLILGIVINALRRKSHKIEPIEGNTLSEPIEK